MDDQFQAKLSFIFFLAAIQFATSTHLPYKFMFT